MPGPLAISAVGGFGGGSRRPGPPSDRTILSFALNLEYLEAQFYSYAYWARVSTRTSSTAPAPRARYGWQTGSLQDQGDQGVRPRDRRRRTRPCRVPARRARWREGVAADDRPQDQLHVRSARRGSVKSNQTFDPFANENNLLGAFLFEDVGVTAYKGAAPLINNAGYVEAAAGILAVEAYHAGIIRSSLYRKGLFAEVKKLSAVRDAVDGSSDDDQNLRSKGKHASLVPTDANGLVYSRAPGNVINIVYLTPASVTKGGFYPDGVNGELNTSSNNTRRRARSSQVPSGSGSAARETLLPHPSDLVGAVAGFRVHVQNLGQKSLA